MCALKSREVKDVRVVVRACARMKFLIGTRMVF